MDSLETVRAAFEILPQLRGSRTSLVKRVRNLTRIIYVSAIAHPVASQTHLPVAIVVAELLPLLRLQLQQADGFLGLPISLNTQSTLEVSATHSGLIEIEFPDRAIAFWLQDLLAAQLTPPPLESKLKLQSAAVFAAQHSHARCCSLLRRGHTEKLITLRDQGEPIEWQIEVQIEGRSRPLIPDSPQWSQPARLLVVSLFSLWVALFQPTEQPNLLLTTASQSFHQLHRQFQPFCQPLDASYWLLLLATQRVLYRLLEKLQVPMPIEL